MEDYPTSYKEVNNPNDVEFLKEDIYSELESKLANDTCDLAIIWFNFLSEARFSNCFFSFG